MTSGVVRKIGNTALRRRLADQVWENCEAGQYMATGIGIDFDVDILLTTDDIWPGTIYDATQAPTCGKVTRNPMQYMRKMW